MKSSILLLGLAAFAIQAAQAAFVIDVLDKIHTRLSQPKASADGWPITSRNGTELSYTVKSKGHTYDIGRITSLHVPPRPVVGQPFDIEFGYANSVTIDETAYAIISIALGKDTVFDAKQVNICEQLRLHSASVQCPVEPGQHKVRASVTLPANIPRARYTINIDAFGRHPVQDGEKPLATFSIDANFLYHGTWLEWFENTYVAAEKMWNKGMRMLSEGILPKKTKAGTRIEL